ncbi:MAG: transposase [Melioribacteraceae bacterium]
MALFQNKYRIESIRLKDWDYSSPWWYYVTINTKGHAEYFGKIVKGKMDLNELGSIAEEEWLKTKSLRSNIDLDYYVIMPNHIHGIIILNNEKRRDVARYVSTQNIIFSKISPKENSLSAIIRSFKSAVSKRMHELGFYHFSWQSRFYERIIRNEKELMNIRKYIEQNPMKWDIEKNDYENLIVD